MFSRVGCTDGIPDSLEAGGGREDGGAAGVRAAATGAGGAPGPVLRMAAGADYHNTRLAPINGENADRQCGNQSKHRPRKQLDKGFTARVKVLTAITSSF